MDRALESAGQSAEAVRPTPIPGGSPVGDALAIAGALPKVDSVRRAELVRALQRCAGNAVTSRMLQRDQDHDGGDDKAKFRGFVAAENWKDAVDLLKGFDGADIKLLLRPLSAHALIALRDAAAEAYPGDIATNPDHIANLADAELGRWDPRYGRNIVKQYAEIKQGIATPTSASTYGGTTLATIDLTLDELKKILLPERSGDAERDAHVKRLELCLPFINAAFRIMKIDTVEAQSVILAHTAGETGTLLVLERGHGFEEFGASERSYAPFVGRGVVQITFKAGYEKTLAVIDRMAESLVAAGDPDAAYAIEAVAAVKRDIKSPADPRYAFLTSAAYFYWSKGVEKAAKLGATASFAGGHAADVWVSGSSREWQAIKAEAEAKLAVETDPAARKRLEGTIRDMNSTISRAAVKEATYARAYTELSKKKVTA